MSNEHSSHTLPSTWLKGEGITRRDVLLAAPMTLLGASAQVGFCIGTYGMKDLPIDAALKLIATTGYDGVELSLMPGWQCDPATLSSADRQRLRSLLTETRLQVAALNEVLSITSDSRARNLERLKLAADLGHHLVPHGKLTVETTLGGKTADWSTSREHVVDELQSWAQVGEQHDLTVCFKPHAGQIVHNSGRAIELLRAVHSPRLQVCYDYCHMFVASEPLESSFRALAPHIGFITLKDARWIDGGHEFLLPGDGNTDYQLYFRLLKELRYHGWVAAEVTAMIWRKPGYDPAIAARKAYANIAPLWEFTGLARRSRG